MKNLKQLFEFYQTINQKNNGKLNLEDFEIDEDNKVNVEEDIIDNISHDLRELENIINSLGQLKMDKTLDEINYDLVFHDGIARLIGVYADLSSEFTDLYEFHSKFVQSLPEGPKDDSELI
ncbi:hypothetical protein GIX45_16875 [Erwinia sp. CPCC 100877]|nr:hypothetical protein [Erwinia sp. CPCC 100877]